jgi:hypothetical protein
MVRIIVFDARRDCSKRRNRCYLYSKPWRYAVFISAASDVNAIGTPDAYDLVPKNDQMLRRLDAKRVYVQHTADLGRLVHPHS